MCYGATNIVLQPYIIILKAISTIQSAAQAHTHRTHRFKLLVSLQFFFAFTWYRNQIQHMPDIFLKKAGKIKIATIILEIHLSN